MASACTISSDAGDAVCPMYQVSQYIEAANISVLYC